MITKLKQSYESFEEIEGFDELRETEQGKVKRAWDEGAISGDDRCPGEALPVEKKTPVRRVEKDSEGEMPVEKRMRKVKVRICHIGFLRESTYLLASRRMLM